MFGDDRGVSAVVDASRGSWNNIENSKNKKLSNFK